jgi:hypothetical protein
MSLKMYKFVEAVLCKRSRHLIKLSPRTSDEVWQEISGIYLCSLFAVSVQINSSTPCFLLDKSSV